MSKRSRIISKYKLKDDQSPEPMIFLTIEKINKTNERVFVKNVPAQSVRSPIVVGNILDRPQDINWTDKKSHYEIIDPDFQRNDYNPAYSAGSFCVASGTFTVLKNQSGSVVAFPLDPVNQNNPVTKCEFSGKMSSGTCFMGSVDAPTWIGYVTASGTVKPIFPN